MHEYTPLAVLLLLICVTPAIAGSPVELDSIGSGELLWKSEQGLIPLPLLDTEVELAVTGMVVHGRLTQHFHNPAPEVVEAIYVFPLPDRAAVNFMEIRIGERRIVSEIREKEEAKRTYERAKQSGKKAALIDQRRPNLFTTAVANINPGETVSVVLEYLEEATYRDGEFGMRFPLTFTPRFLPSGGSEDIKTGPIMPMATISVKLQPGIALEEVLSGSHDIEVDELKGSYQVRPVEGRIVADRDFILSWRPRLGEAPQATVFLEEREEESYAMVMLMPPESASDAGLGLPTETLFIIDVSSSMSGPSIRQARRALLAALGRLRQEDRFNILKFNNDNTPFHPGFQQAVPEILAEARGWVSALDATGGTMIYPALEHGLEMMGASGSSHAQRIVFLTDGAVGNEREVLDLIVERLGEVRLHAIGIGHAPNSYLMRKMADFGRGLCEFISSAGEAENRISNFFERLDRPVMTDLEMIWDGLDIDEAYPRRPRDLYAGEPLILSARLAPVRSAGEMRLSGWTREGWITSSVAVDASSPRGNGIATRWARAKVGSLMDSLHEGADPRAVRSEVLELAMEFNLVTAYSSLVAVEESASALGEAHRVRMAAALPAGGSGNPLRRLLGLSLLVAGLCLLAVAWRWMK
jgi:Ca-activated chloride channel family protein